MVFKLVCSDEIVGWPYLVELIDVLVFWQEFVKDVEYTFCNWAKKRCATCACIRQIVQVF
jgi:hypothetical protein